MVKPGITIIPMELMRCEGTGQQVKIVYQMARFTQKKRILLPTPFSTGYPTTGSSGIVRNTAILILSSLSEGFPVCRPFCLAPSFIYKQR